ncbi:MAG: RNA polymerase sigma factor [Phycisphaerales bacterium]
MTKKQKESSSEWSEITARLQRAAGRLRWISTEDREDVVQETLSRLLHYRHTARSAKERVRIAFGIFRNVVAERRRNSLSESKAMARAGQARLASPATPRLRRPLEEYAKLIAALDEGQRTILRLRIVNDLDYRTIAELLGMTEEAVRQAYSRAALRLSALAGVLRKPVRGRR